MFREKKNFRFKAISLYEVSLMASPVLPELKCKYSSQSFSFVYIISFSGVIEKNGNVCYC